ncbi:MAG: TerC family protein [Candidatus Woesearchaeota archaeon]|jgi:tellurite resistance protein TerC
MITIPGVDPIFMWIGFLILVAIFLVLDLGVFNKKQHEVSVKEALVWTGVWFGVAMLFNLFIYLEFGSEKAMTFLGGYLLEKSLSIDNIFVIFLIFTSFRVEKKYQHKILFWGIVGAIFLRGLLIILGSALVDKFHWIFYLFGAFLIYSAIHMVIKKDEDYDPHQSWIVRTIHKIVPVVKEHKKGNLFARQNGRRAVTILFVALIVVEFSDVVFAFDSIPAIFGITTDPFIVFTSNIFAILGLRSLYFVIAKIHDTFKYLSYGLALILTFIGVKMIIMDWVHISIGTSLIVVFSLLALSIVLSLIFGKKQTQLEQKKKNIKSKKAQTTKLKKTKKKTK